MTSPSALPLTDGRHTVPGNRWDLLDGHAASSPLPTVGVVIPYYEQQGELDLVLSALDSQDYPRHLIEVVVSDDGSRTPPDVSASSLRCSVVTQEDNGFRAAAARNHGARSTDARILCFLDADTVPQPGYLSSIVRLPSLLPDALVVGRRRHADLGGWTPQDLRRWRSGGPGPDVLDEPRWLRDGYAQSSDLLDIDHRSYRYIISSVMCCSRELFDYCGGFDESFERYGGEDWEFAHRAVSCGAVLHHAREAVAWHNGPDWAGRDVENRAAAKNAEALALARLITDPDARTHGLRYPTPDLAVHIDAADHGAGSLVVAAGCFLGRDAGVWVDGAQSAALLEHIGASDPRLHVGPIPAHIRRRCRFVVTVTGRPRIPRTAVDEMLRRCSAPGVAAVEIRSETASIVCRSSWNDNRVRRWTTGPVRLARPGDADRMGATDRWTTGAAGMVEVERDETVAW